MHGSKNWLKDHIHAHCVKQLTAAFNAFNDKRVVLILQLQQNQQSPEFNCEQLNELLVT